MSTPKLPDPLRAMSEEGRREASRLDEIRARVDRGYVYVPMSDVTEAAIDDVAYLLRELDARTAERDRSRQWSRLWKYLASLQVGDIRGRVRQNMRLAKERDAAYAAGVAAERERVLGLVDEYTTTMETFATTEIVVLPSVAAAIREGGEK